MTPGVSVESEKEKAPRPLFDLRVLMASHNSVIYTAFTGVICEARGSSVNIIEKVAATDLSAFIVTVQMPVPLSSVLATGVLNLC